MVLIARLLALAALVVATACQQQPATPTPAAAPAAQSPSPKPAASPLPSPSPGVSASPSPSPSPSPGPSPVPAAAQQPQLDEYPFSVMIDNIAEARPHFGLGEADVVYEAPAEGGIPRLMPVYLRAGTTVDRIGPVRSIRHYFVYIANEFRAPMVHIGSSPQGFDALAATGLANIDEQRGDAGFLRDPTRRAPHNAFVTTDSVREVLRQRGGPIRASAGTLNFGLYRPGGEPAVNIRIDYPGGERYSVAYAFDADSKRYTRVMDGRPHLDGVTSQQYAATSIVVQFAPVVPIPNDSAFRVDVALVGSGRGVLIAEGTQVPLQWTRASVREATQFVRSDGAPFSLPNGQVWIQIVPVEARVEIS